MGYRGHFLRITDGKNSLEGQNLEIARQAVTLGSDQQANASEFEHYFYLIFGENTLR